MSERNTVAIARLSVLLVFVSVGILGVLQAPARSLFVLIPVVVAVLGFGLKEYWGGLATAAPRIWVALGGVALCLLGVSFGLEIQVAEQAARLLMGGALTAGLALPAGIDPAISIVARLYRVRRRLEDPGIGAAFLLYRNRLLGIVAQLQLGARLALAQRGQGVGSFFRTASLLGISLAGRVPATSQELLTAAYVSGFDIGRGDYVGSVGAKYYLILILGAVACGGFLL